MSSLRVSPTQDYLTRNGKPFFYLADTIWMAFANIPLVEWDYYLSYRKMQGFNALQISILPVTHDTSMSPNNIDPFHKDANGNWDFTAYNEAYFDKAERMVAAAVEKGFVPVLGILWCSYVPQTRCSQNSPIASAMPYEAVQPYAAYAAQRFKQYDPVFFISGDTRFESPEEARYYMTALQTVKSICPDALLTMHLHPQGELPREFIDAIDFYMYQSGHSATRQDLPYLWAEKFSAYPVKRPVLNAEPCYEGHGRGGTQTRFTAFDVRKATWQSLLSGAKVGITYGGHGVWSSHRHGMTFLNIKGSFEPYDRTLALSLEGSWDVSYAKWIFETYKGHEWQPAAIVQNDNQEIRAAMNADRSTVAVYIPYSFDVDLALDLTGYTCIMLDLANRRVTTPEVTPGATSRIRMLPFNGDALFIATKPAT